MFGDKVRYMQDNVVYNSLQELRKLNIPISYPVVLQAIRDNKIDISECKVFRLYNQNLCSPERFAAMICQKNIESGYDSL